MSSETSLLKEIVLGLIVPLLSLCRTYEYTVKNVAADGRMDLWPTKSKLAPKLSGVPQWGPSGTRARPRFGSTVAVQFLDGDAGRPVVSSFVPLSTQVGQPARVEIDAEELVLAQGTHPAGRGGATLGLVGAAGTGTLTLTTPNGVVRQWTIAATGFTVTPVPPNTGIATIDEGRAAVLV